MCSCAHAPVRVPVLVCMCACVCVCVSVCVSVLHELVPQALRDRSLAPEADRWKNMTDTLPSLVAG